MKEKLLVLCLLVGLILVWGCSPTPIAETDGRKFTLEYDHQLSYDAFAWGKNKVENAFEEANTTLEFVYNDTLPDSLIRVDSLGRYYLNHVERDSTGVQALYEGYLCGIKGVCDNNGVDLDTLWGATSGYPGPYSWSFICMDSELPGGCVQKTIIHELGHQRAGLTHLCLPDTTMNPAHSDSSCVMGQGEFAICTDFDLCWDPQFCENCRNALTNVSW